MRQFWDQLTTSQKRTVTVGLVFAGVVLLAQFVVLPYFEARQRVRSAIVASEKALQEITALGAEYGILKQRWEEIRRASERRTAGFTLLSYLERRAGDAALRTNIRSLTPLMLAPSGAFEETAVEMKLDKLTMKQLTDFLYLVESTEEMIRVRRISVVKMKENPEYLSALIQVLIYQPLKSGSR
jgi:general secretion pathway protein M